MQTSWRLNASSNKTNLPKLCLLMNPLKIALAAAGENNAASDQVKTLIFLHGGQCHRELKQWKECEKWLREVVDRFPNTPYLSTVIYEIAYCKQQQNELEEALKLYAEVANKYRNEVAARERF